HLRWRPDSAKHLLRRLLAEHVPAALWAGPKRGFDPPLRALLTYDDHVLVRRHLLDAGGVLDGLLARDEVQRHVQRFLAGDPHGLFRIWALVVLSAWLQAHAPAGAARPVHPCPVEEPLC
ncbi:MAG: asparagine synthase C-terminal domain-containing protein, partial [Thiobacillaceae bacterium]|nr:asparagine synthase C-terminal domain-containing protein [Thiobacillaceae bacterium]